MPNAPVGGIGLEARVQRYFLAQGVFAERHLFPTASPNHRMLATDIDVLVSEYAGGFHITRRHAECKGGKVHLLDRIFWLSGVRTLLKADGSYLIISNYDKDASDFASALNIQLLTIKQLEGWETSIQIPRDVWPCRSNYQVYDVCRATWMKMRNVEEQNTDWQLLYEVLSFVEIDSWLGFKYRDLNKLMRYLQTISKKCTESSNEHHILFCRYLISALLVRFCQYLLAVCYDVSRLPTTDMANYLTQRLSYGDQEPERVSGLIEGTVDWVKKALGKKGIPLPPEIDIGRLYEAPPYTKEFLALINRLLQQSNEARYLTIAMETSQFDTSVITDKFPRLKAATNAGDSLASLVRAFVVRVFSVPKEFTDPLINDLKVKYSARTFETRKKPVQKQPKLPLN